MTTYFRKYNDMPMPAKASLWYTVCNILQKGIAFITVPIYTRVLTTGEYGQYSVFQSWSNILIIFATLNLYCGVFTKAMVDYDDDRDCYISCMQGLSTTITACMFIVYIFAAGYWNSVFDTGTVTMLLMFLYFIFYPSLQFWSVRQRVEYKYKKMVVVTLLVSILTPALSLFLLFNSDLRANAIIWGSLIAQIVVGAIFYIYQFWRGKVFFIKKYWLHGIKFNIPLIPHYLSLIVLAQSDRIMIKNYCGDEKAGIYNLAYQVSMVMSVFVNAINNSFVPWIYEKLKIKEYSSIRKNSNLLCILVGGLTIGIILFAPEAIKILGTAEYYEAIWCIPPVALSVYFTFIYGLFGDVEFYYGATHYVMIASTVGAVLNIILNAIFIPICGFVAAAYTTLFCYFVFMVMHYLFMRRVCRKRINGAAIFGIKFLSLSCVALCIITFLCALTYDFTIIRYGLILCVLIMLLFNRRKLTQQILIKTKCKE